MRYDDPNTRDLLTAEYALGTLRGSARKRFEALLAQRSDWQITLRFWTERLSLLADTIPAVSPGKHVWKNIQTRAYGKAVVAESKSTNWWQSLAFGASGIAAALGFLLVTSEPQRIEVPVQVPVEVAVEVQAPTTVALLTTPQATPGWLVALAKNKTGKHEIRVSALASLKTAQDNAFELWLLPPDKSAPVSLGVLPQQGNQQVVVSEKVANLLLQSGLAVSLEPIGGSPTGQPTGAVLYQGKLTQI